MKKLSIALMSLAVAACSSGPEQVTPNENSNTNLTTTLSLSFSPLEFFDYFPGDEWVNVTGGTVQVFAELQMKCKGGSIYASLELNTMGSDDAWHQVFWDFIHPDPDYDLGVIKKRFGHSFLLPPGGKFRWAVREDASDSVCITGDHVFTGPSMFSFQKIDISAPSVD